MTFQESSGLIHTATVVCDTRYIPVYSTPAITMELSHNKNFNKLYGKLVLGFLINDNFGEIDEQAMKYNMAHKDEALGNYPVKHLHEKSILIKRDSNILYVMFPSEY